MDLQHFLAVNMMVISALAILMSLMQAGAGRNLLWLAVNGLVVLVGLAALRLIPQSAGSIVGAVFAPLVAAPFVLGLLNQRAALRGQQRRAALYARLLALVHPSRHMRLTSAMTSAWAKPTVAAQVAAMAAMLTDCSPGERISIEGQMLRAKGDWQGLLDHFRNHQGDIAGVGALEIRALAELGRLDAMAEAYEATRSRLSGQDLLEAQLVVLAFGGRPDAVATLLNGPLAALGQHIKTYWTAVARCAAGAGETWREPLHKLLAGAPDEPFRRRVERLLASPPTPAASMGLRSQAIVDGAIQRVREAEAPRRSSLLAAPITWLLILAICAVYVAAEMRGGSENLRVLVEMGAMWPPYVERRGEWWRLVTALFLHLGPLHLGVNALMLWVLGRAAEQAYGSLAMLLVYLAGGIASTGFVLWLAWSRYTEPAVLIGASGAVMALFGGIVAHRLVSWLSWRDPVDRRAVILLPAILVLQIAADLASPQVSLAAHVSGFVAGLVLGLPLAMAVRGRSRSPG
jgi:rhomboid protease GluP